MVATTIANIPLQHPIFNASGPKCTTFEELNALGESAASAILHKSCTLEPRQGNPEPRYVDLKLGSINSMGLPNLGYAEYARMMPDLKKFGKPVFSSVSGLCLSDNITMIQALNETAVDAIELNLSCPNLVGKPQVGYDMDQSDNVLRETLAVAKKPLGVKLPPYFDFVHFEQMAAILNKHHVAFVTCINSIGNALFVDPEKECAVIKPKGGFGGIGGDYIKPTALANVRKFYELLRKDIHVVGCGGIKTGGDVFEHILCGANAVQVGTQLMKEGPTCFERIAREFENVIEQKGYKTIEEFRGKLKAL